MAGTPAEEVSLEPWAAMGDSLAQGAEPDRRLPVSRIHGMSVMRRTGF
jgi:hypothetical protein